MGDEVPQYLDYLAFYTPILPSQLLKQGLYYFLFQGFFPHLG
jgi:hypothetical protein